VPRRVALADRKPRRIPGLTLPRWETVPVAVVDAGTGVDPASITATLDGRPLVVEPDLVRDRVLVTVPDATPAGRHELVLAAADRAGNGSTRTLELHTH